MPLRRSSILAAVAVALFVGAGGAQAAKKRRAPKPTPTPGPVYGPAVPTPRPLLRAAGSCVRYEPNQYLLLAEVGEAGRMFRVDAETQITVPGLRGGTRVRVLYVDDTDGPLAKKVMPGPMVVPPTAGASSSRPPSS